MKFNWAGAQQNQQNDLCTQLKLITVRMKKPWVFSFLFERTTKTDQTVWMQRLIWVFAECTGNFVGFVALQLSWKLSFLFRDIGSSLRSLHVLWASRCCLIELDGISSMCNLKELYLSYNEISDISPLSMLDQLEILDLEGWVSPCSYTWVVTWQNQQNGCAPSEDSDQPGHPPSLIQSHRCTHEESLGS